MGGILRPGKIQGRFMAGGFFLEDVAPAIAADPPAPSGNLFAKRREYCLQQSASSCYLNY